jgi:hypothetical protein
MKKAGWYTFRFLLVSVPLLLGVAMLLAWRTSYEVFTALLLQFLGQATKLDKFRAALLPEVRFVQIRGLLLVCWIFSVLFTLFLWNKGHSIVQLVQRFGLRSGQQGLHLIRLWKHTGQVEKGLTFLLGGSVAVTRAFFLFRLPFHVDERFSYLYFVSKGPGVSMAYYPGPNNHILFTLLCNVANLFLDNPISVMKVPGYLAGFVAVILFWFIVRSFFEAQVAFLATAVFSFTDPVFYYGMQGRGYSLLVVFVLLTTKCMLQITQPGSRGKAAFVWLGISSVLGFYTIPVFLYPFLGLLLYGFIQLFRQSAWQRLQYLGLTIVATAAFTFFLYLPVLLFNGWSAVSGNAWVQPVQGGTFLRQLPGYVTDILTSQWDQAPFPALLTAGLLGWACLVVFHPSSEQASRQWAGVLLSWTGVTLLLLLVQRVFPPARTFIYFSVVQYPLLALALVRFLEFITKRKELRYAGLVTLGVLGLSIRWKTYLTYTDPSRFDIYDSFDQVAQVLYRQKADSIYTPLYDYGLCIRFLYETQGHTLQLTSGQPAASQPYAFLVMPVDQAFYPDLHPADYWAIYSDSLVTIYRQKQK